jgi:hypothetical protein
MTIRLMFRIDEQRIEIANFFIAIGETIAHFVPNNFILFGDRSFYDNAICFQVDDNSSG